MKIFQKILFFSIIGIILISCSTDHKSKMYGDVIGFNDDVILTYQSGLGTKPPHNLETQAGQRIMLQEINGLRQGANTAAFYALDVGLDRIAHVQKKFMDSDPNSRYYIIFFTDGLDNVSTTLAERNRRGKYNNTNEYAGAIQSRMDNILKNYKFFGMIKKTNTTNTFQSYVLLYKGDDILKSGYTDRELDEILKPFTGSQNEQRPSVIQGHDLDQLYEDFKNAFIVTSFSFIIPKGYTGQRIRMNLTQRGDVWIEGDLKRDKKRKTILLPFKKEDIYTLENTTSSNGLVFDTANGTITMDKTKYNANLNTVPFIVNGLRLNNSPYSVRREHVTQWFYDGGRLRLNSEYDSTTGSIKNAYVLLIMDTSLSFAGQMDAAKKTAGQIVMFITDQM